MTFDYLKDFEEEEDLQVAPELFSEVVTWGTDWTIGTIVNLIVKGKVDLSPKMQRREVWKDDKKSRLVESLILNIPIPQIILAEKKDSKGSYMVIDGKQRLLSVLQFMNGISVTHLPEYKTLRLKGLEILSSLNNKIAQDILDNPIDGREYIDIFENQTIRTIIIKNWENENILYTVFNRLNTGTEPLSPQELRMTLHPGPFMNFINENSSFEELLELLKIEGPDSRMRDVELVIRYFAFKYFLKQYNGNLKKFFDITVMTLNNNWLEKDNDIENQLENLKYTISFVKEIFSDSYFKKFDSEKQEYTRQFNKSAFDLLTYYLSKESLRETINHLDNGKELFKKTYEDLFYMPIINEDFQAHTTDLSKVKNRFMTFGDMLEKNFNISLDIPFKE